MPLVKNGSNFGYDCSSYTSNNANLFNVSSTLITSSINADAKNYIVNHWDEIQEQVEAEKEKQEKREFENRIAANKRYRSLVKHVHWSGNTCIMYWKDGTITKARWNAWEDFDPEKAMLVCMARKLYNNSGLYNEVLEKYADDGWDHFDREFARNKLLL